MTSKTFNLSLTHDQLAYLLVTLRMPPLMGMNTPVYPPDFPPQIVFSRMQAAGLTLQTQGLIKVIGTLPEEILNNNEAEPMRIQVQINTSLSAILGAVTLARYVIMVGERRSRTQPLTSRYIYTGSSLAIEHHFDSTEGVHHFAATVSNDVVMDFVTSRMDLELPPLRSGEYTLPANVIPEILVPDMTHSIAVEHLISAGIPAQDAGNIALMLRSYESQMMVALYEANPPNSKRSSAGEMNVIALYSISSVNMRVRGMLRVETNIMTKTTTVTPYSPRSLHHDLSEFLTQIRVN